MDECLIWKRALESAKAEIEQAETIIIINKELIRVSERKLKEIPPPKVEKEIKNKDLG